MPDVIYWWSSILKLALLTGPSGSGKRYVKENINSLCECLSYDNLMAESVKVSFPHFIDDKWDKSVWHENRFRLDLTTAFSGAFTWMGNKPLLVEGYQLRETVWRKVILDLARKKVGNEIEAKLFIIAPTLDQLLAWRRSSSDEYHNANANVEHCVNEIAMHNRMYVEQPWEFEIQRTETKEEALGAISDFLSAV